jgi:hypothetical protein
MPLDWVYNHVVASYFLLYIDRVPRSDLRGDRLNVVDHCTHKKYTADTRGV